jgi:hypothetical protein
MTSQSFSTEYSGRPEWRSTAGDVSENVVFKKVNARYSYPHCLQLGSVSASLTINRSYTPREGLL